MSESSKNRFYVPSLLSVDGSMFRSRSYFTEIEDEGRFVGGISRLIYKGEGRERDRGSKVYKRGIENFSPIGSIQVMVGV